MIYTVVLFLNTYLFEKERERAHARIHKQSEKQAPRGAGDRRTQ